MKSQKILFSILITILFLYGCDPQKTIDEHREESVTAPPPPLSQDSTYPNTTPETASTEVAVSALNEADITRAIKKPNVVKLFSKKKTEVEANLLPNQECAFFVINDDKNNNWEVDVISDSNQYYFHLVDELEGKELSIHQERLHKYKGKISPNLKLLVGLDKNVKVEKPSKKIRLSIQKID
jgi:hypothetical protein